MGFGNHCSTCAVRIAFTGAGALPPTHASFRSTGPLIVAKAKEMGTEGVISISALFSSFVHSRKAKPSTTTTSDRHNG